MRIAVTGCEGQVALSLLEKGAESGHEILRLGRPALDLAGNPQEIGRVIEAVSPDVIVSAAAYTAVDRAEAEPDIAFAVNERGARAVAETAARLDVPLIHLSTDYVFSGAKAEPYVETDQTVPISIYGSSKLAGERAVLSAHQNTVILRTAWVYSPFGTNFVKTMLRLAGDRDEIPVVADQVGNPTSALDIAQGVIRVASNLTSSSEAAMRGIFHMTAAGEATWADLAEAVFAISLVHGGPDVRVRRIPAADYPRPAQRPANSRLNCSKLEATHGLRLHDWRTSLGDVVQRLVSQSTEVKATNQ